MARRVVRTKTEQTLVRIARSIAWSGSLTTASLVTPHQRRSRSGEGTLGKVLKCENWRDCPPCCSDRLEPGSSRQMGGVKRAIPER